MDMRRMIDIDDDPHPSSPLLSCHNYPWADYWQRSKLKGGLKVLEEANEDAVRSSIKWWPVIPPDAQHLKTILFEIHHNLAEGGSIEYSMPA